MLICTHRRPLWLRYFSATPIRCLHAAPCTKRSEKRSIVTASQRRVVTCVTRNAWVHLPCLSPPVAPSCALSMSKSDM